jgi:predicted phage-related endonuclease
MNANPEQDRTQFIGGSDIATMLNLDPYKSRAELYAEKSGAIDPPDLSEKEQIQWGNLLESAILKETFRRFGQTDFDSQVRLTHPAYSFLRGTADGIGGGVLVDAKNSARASQYETDFGLGLPVRYHCQMTWYRGLALLNGHEVRESHLAALIGGHKLIVIAHDYRPEEFDAMVQAAVAFWNSVRRGIPPDLSEGPPEIIRAIHKVCPEKTVLADEEMERLVRAWDRIRARRLRWKKLIDAKENAARCAVELAAGDAELIRLPGLGTELFRGSDSKTAYDIPEDVKDQYKTTRSAMAFRMRKESR